MQMPLGAGYRARHDSVRHQSDSRRIRPDDPPHGRMLITVFTDASYCSRSRVGAYAAWAKADGRTVRHSGVLKQKVASSTLAETMALVNGIFVALAAMRPPAASKIIARTDCLAAIHALTGLLRKAATTRQHEIVVAAYHEKIAAAGITVEFRHVSGHKGTVTPRNAVNTWCDAECRRLLRGARASASKPADLAAAV
ncbi:MAG TPA: RNase H family protein [Acetobacteraceae bacterium]|nr:RNase H family protein [Acetobacteraceae bacterium]